MSLRINTNVAALNSYNNLNANQAKLEGAFQQLSSGLRINKAADDAAGLSIAQGLTSQINGLTQAVSNANDGINVAQIADGALGTTQDILQRMRGLVVKAGNEGTQDSKSLGAIKQEIQNLNTQLDNIAKQTKFGQTNLLDGSYNLNFQVGANGNDTISLNLSHAATYSTNVGGSSKAGTDGVNLTALNVVTNGGAAAVAGFNPDAQSGNPAATTIDNNITTGYDDDGDANTPLVKWDAFASGGTATTIERAASGQEGWVIKDGSANAIGTITVNSSGVYTVTDTSGTDGPKVLGQIDGAVYDTKATDPVAGALPASGSLNKLVTSAFNLVNDHFQLTDDGNGGWDVTDNSADDSTTVTAVGNLSAASNGVYTLTDMNGNTVGTLDTNSDKSAAAGAMTYSSADADADLTSLNKAIDAISSARSGIGAVQNQLSYTVSNLQTAITNVTASRSNLTDADLAQQVTAMTQSQILTQAATSVLAQANSAPQAILKLLQ